MGEARKDVVKPKCPVCSVEMSPETKIAQCISGHHLCWVCLEKLNDKRDCPSCSQPVNGRAFGMESYLRTLFHKEETGCSEEPDVHQQLRFPADPFPQQPAEVAPVSQQLDETASVSHQLDETIPKQPVEATSGHQEKILREIRPKPDTFSTSNVMQKIQIVRSTEEGKIQVKGLLPGQKLVSMPDGRLKIFSGKELKVNGLIQNQNSSHSPESKNLTQEMLDLPSSNTTPHPKLEPEVIIEENPLSEIKTEPPSTSDHSTASDEDSVSEVDEIQAKVHVDNESGKVEGHQQPSRSFLNNYITKDILDDGKRVYKCTICGKSSSAKARGNLKNHIESVHFPKLFTHTCKFCGRQYNSRNSLYVHTSTKHREDN